MSTELENIDQLLDTPNNAFCLNGLDPVTFRETFLFEVLFRYSKLKRWSFNCNPAAQHQDCFQKNPDKGFSGLENKICLTSRELYPVFGHRREEGVQLVNQIGLYCVCLTGLLVEESLIEVWSVEEISWLSTTEMHL